MKMIKLKAVCCVCGKVYREGPTLNGNVSHGYCPKHEKEARIHLLRQIENEYQSRSVDG